jgi:hypothetical protein
MVRDLLMAEIYTGGLRHVFFAVKPLHQEGNCLTVPVGGGGVGKFIVVKPPHPHQSESNYSTLSNSYISMFYNHCQKASVCIIYTASVWKYNHMIGLLLLWFRLYSYLHIVTYIFLVFMGFLVDLRS